MKKFKKHQSMCFGHIGVHWVRHVEKSLRDSCVDLLSIKANMGIYQRMNRYDLYVCPVSQYVLVEAAVDT